MELEKLQKIIAEVLNVDEAEVTMDTTDRKSTRLNSSHWW